MDARDTLKGLRVIDFSQGVAGPLCGMTLAQYGASVIKIEPPAGDWGRRLGTPAGDLTAYACAYNLGKRSLSLDLKTTEGQAIARSLCESADVVIENFRPGAMDRLGLGYADLSRVNDRLVYLSISGFGRDGPGAGMRATDTVMQAFSGFVSINRGNDGAPHKSDMAIADVSTGLFASQRLLMALLARERGGGGGHLNVSLMHATTAFMAANLILHQQNGGKAGALLVPAGTFPTKDGHLNITTLTDGDFRKLCTAVGRPDMADDPRYAMSGDRIGHAEEIQAAFRAIFQTRTTREWCETLEAHDLLAAPVHDFDDLLAHPQFRHEAPVLWVDQDGVGPLPYVLPPGLPAGEADERRLQAPHCGQHSREILAELGYGDAEIDRMIAAGVTRAGQHGR